MRQLRGTAHRATRLFGVDSVAAPYRQVRAQFDAETITVYQAYRPEIADAAVAAGTFVEPFSRSRMTWVKPSFLWMMYRCGWATKPGQERVLAVRLSRAGFEEALSQAVISHFDPDFHADAAAWRADISGSLVRLQWDPERRPDGSGLPYRSLQLGLSGAAVAAYVDRWIVGITDITASLPAIRSGLTPLPVERPYPLNEAVAAQIGAE